MSADGLLQQMSPASAAVLWVTPASPLLLQVFWALQLVTVLVPGAVFHLYAACKNIDQEEILERPIYTVFYIISVLLRIILEVIAFWLQSHLFGFQVGRGSRRQLGFPGRCWFHQPWEPDLCCSSSTRSTLSTCVTPAPWRRPSM